MDMHLAPKAHWYLQTRSDSLDPGSG